VESLERRAMLSVTSLNITSITSLADTDGVAADEHVRVVAGDTVTVNFDYSSTATNPTTAKVDINTFPATVATSTVTIASGANRSAALSLVIPAGTTPGSYNAHVQVRNGNGSGSVQNDTDAAAVDVVLAVTVVTPDVSLTAADDIYTGLPYDEANLDTTLVPAGAIGTVSYAYYSDAAGTTLMAAPVDAGTYYVQAFFTSMDDGYADAESSVVPFDIMKAEANIHIGDYSGTYDGEAHGLTGSATGVQDEDLSSLLALGAAYPDAGSYTVNWSFAGNQNYHSASGTGTIEIAKAEANIHIGNYSGTYDGEAHGLTGSATGVQDEDLSSLLALGATYTDAGSYTVNWSFAGNQNYHSAGGTGTIEIAKAMLTANQMNIDIRQQTLNLMEQGYVSVAITLDRAFDVRELSSIFVEGNTTYKWSIDTVSNTILVSVKATDILASYKAGAFASTDSGWTQQGKGANAAYVDSTTFDVSGSAQNFAFNGISDYVNLLLTQKAAASVGLIS